MVSDASLGPIVPVILCGGSGTRLWPRSRRHRPKPFLPLLGPKSLFEETIERFGGNGRFTAPVIVAGAAHRGLIEKQLAGRKARLAIEPAARNTAPAIALAARLLDPEDIMLVCPSDHHIARPDAFRDAVADAARLARDGWLVSLGIVPTAPETGYGYLKRGAPLGGGFATESFVEKPELARAEAFLADGGYLWNAGIFVFTAGRLLEELASHRPQMAAGVEQACAGARHDGATVYPAASPFDVIQGESIDYAVMEETDRAALVEADIGWSDIGSWTALRDAREADSNGNVVIGNAELVDCRAVMVDSDGPRVSVIGLEDVIVVVDGDEVLVTSAAGAQGVGRLGGASAQ